MPNETRVGACDGVCLCMCARENNAENSFLFIQFSTKKFLLNLPTETNVYAVRALPNCFEIHDFCGLWF